MKSDENHDFIRFHQISSDFIRFHQIFKPGILNQNSLQTPNPDIVRKQISRIKGSRSPKALQTVYCFQVIEVDRWLAIFGLKALQVSFQSFALEVAENGQDLGKR